MFIIPSEIYGVSHFPREKLEFSFQLKLCFFQNYQVSEAIKRFICGIDSIIQRRLSITETTDSNSFCIVLMLWRQSASTTNMYFFTGLVKNFDIVFVYNGFPSLNFGVQILFETAKCSVEIFMYGF